MSEQTVPDLYSLAFMPGCFRCPQCGFILSKATLHAATGEIDMTESNRNSECCPNDGTFMVHVTYREQMGEYMNRLKEELDANDALRAKLEAAEQRVRHLEAIAKRALIAKLENHHFGVSMQDVHKAWMYDHEPTVKLIPSQETGQLIMEVRSTKDLLRYPFAGVGDNLREAVENAIDVNVSAARGASPMPEQLFTERLK